MARFKLVFKGYCIEEVDAYIKETQEKIALLERTMAGKSPVIEDDLIKRELELTRKAKALDNTFKVFLSLIKSKLNVDDVNEFMLIAKNVDIITQQPQSKDYILKKLNEEIERAEPQPKRIKEVEATDKNADIVCEQKDDSQDAEKSDLEKEEFQGDETVNEDLIISKPSEENSVLIEEKVAVSIEKSRQEEQTENQQKEKEQERGKPLIELEEVESNPSQSLEELCKDLGFMD